VGWLLHLLYGAYGERFGDDHRLQLNLIISAAALLFIGIPSLFAGATALGLLCIVAALLEIAYLIVGRRQWNA
jgi:hypothetical protein